MVLSSVASLLVVLFAFRLRVSRAGICDRRSADVSVSGWQSHGFQVVSPTTARRSVTDGRRVLIYGAGDGGELLLRELRNNRELQLSPIGFLDDDPAKSGKVIQG